MQENKKSAKNTRKFKQTEDFTNEEFSGGKRDNSSSFSSNQCLRQKIRKKSRSRYDTILIGPIDRPIEISVSGTKIMKLVTCLPTASMRMVFYATKKSQMNNLHKKSKTIKDLPRNEIRTKTLTGKIRNNQIFQHPDLVIHYRL